MQQEAKATQVYVGRRVAMIAEVAAWDPTCIDITPADCAWLVLPTGPAQWDTAWFRLKADAMAEARAIAEHHGAKVSFVD